MCRRAAILAVLPALLVGACREPAPAAPEPVGPARVEAMRADCARRGGTLSPAGSGGTLACLRTLRDAGRQCRSADDCEGACLARSGTCAPFAPLFGCNEVLDREGRRVTECLE